MAINPYLAEFEADRDALLPEVQQAESLAPAPTPAPSAPLVADQQFKGYDDSAAMADAIRSRDMANAAGKISDGAALINRGFGGSAPLNMGDKYRATADQGIHDVMRARALADQDRAKQKAARGDALTAALSRADSPESTRLRDQYGGTSVGKLLMDRLGPDRWNQTTGNMLPGAKEQLDSETELLKAQARADALKGAGEGSGEALIPLIEASAQTHGWAPEKVAALKHLAMNGDGKLVRTALGGIVSDEYKQTQANGRAAEAVQASNTRSANSLNWQQEKETQNQVEDFGHRVSDATASIASGLKNVHLMVKPFIDKGIEIPGPGVVNEWIAQHRKPANFLQQPAVKALYGAIDSLNVLNRVDITGAAFGKEEAADLKSTYADMLSSTNLIQSMGRLEDKIRAVLQKNVLSKSPEAQRRILKQFPVVKQIMDGLFSKGGLADGAPAEAPAPSEAPPLPTDAGVKEPPRAESPADRKIGDATPHADDAPAVKMARAILADPNAPEAKKQLALKALQLNGLSK